MVPFAFTVMVPVIVAPLGVMAVTVCVPSVRPKPLSCGLFPDPSVNDPPAGAVTTTVDVPREVDTVVLLTLVVVALDVVAETVAG
jgi:hypothetical protein